MIMHNLSRLVAAFCIAAVATLALTGTAWARAQAPRFMVMIDEKNLGTHNVAEAEKVVSEFLMSKGLQVVDAEMVRTNIDRDKALQAMNSGPRSAAALGLQFGADVVIVGKAVAKGSAEQIKDTSFRSYQATVSLKAIRTDTAEVLATDSRDAVKIHVDDVAGGTLAIREATAPLIASLMPKLLGRLGSGSSGEPQRIQIVIGDVHQVWQVAAVKQILRERIKGTKDVVQRSFVSGVAIFDIVWTFDSQALAEELTLANPGHFRLKVLGVTPNKLDVKLVETGS